MGASTGPRLCTVMRTRMSSGAALAYSTSTSKYRLLVEHTGVEEFVFRFGPRACGVRPDEVLVRVRRLRVLVQVPLIGVGRQVVDVEVVLLDVLAVIAFAVRQPEEAFFEDRVVLVPQADRETQALLVVADPGDPVLAPPVGARSGLVVRQVVPRISVAE